ncbi:DUF5133 domain-containing protein [Streptomyces sp. NPDC056492]|uniref:DUF5133 domain-containing protein n=1 Tax=unclassified Streptomyces TaxID=2593676 RepID=UPI0036A4AF0F
MTDPAEPCAAPDEGGAAGVLMALVPCTVAVARRILDNAVRAVGLPRELVARAVMGLRDDVCAPPGHDLPERAVRAEIERARITSPAPPSAALFPSPFVLRQHVSQVRAARRRTLAAPRDPVQRAELENALYTLCVLTGRRSAHAALMAAEVYLAAHRLPGVGGAPAPA